MFLVTWLFLVSNEVKSKYIYNVDMDTDGKREYFLLSPSLDKVIGSCYGVFHFIFLGVLVYTEYRVSNIDLDLLIFFKGWIHKGLCLIYLLYEYKSFLLFLNSWVMTVAILNGGLFYLSLVFSRRFENNISEKNRYLCNLFGGQVTIICISALILEEDYFITDIIAIFLVHILLISFSLSKDEKKESKPSMEMSLEELK